MEHFHFLKCGEMAFPFPREKLMTQVWGPHLIRLKCHSNSKLKDLKKKSIKNSLNIKIMEMEKPAENKSEFHQI